MASAICLIWASHAYAAGCREAFEAAELSQQWHEAVRICRIEAKAGNAEAQFYFGAMHYMGNGVEEDLAEAIRWFRMAAEQQEPVGQNNLGSTYLAGRGVQRDDAEGLKWIRLSAAQGETLGLYNLGAIYANGEIVPPNLVKAYALFHVAAAKGDPDAPDARETVAASLTTSQKSAGRLLASICAAKDYLNCGF